MVPLLWADKFSLFTSSWLIKALSWPWYRAISQLLLTQFWWNFKGRFQLSWWHLSSQHLSWQHLSLSGITQLLLTRFWWKFKDCFLGTSRTDSNCHGDICRWNIHPGDICPYQEYLGSYWPDFDDTLKVQGVRQNCTHFCFLNISASKGSRNSIFDIFQ